MEMSDGNDDGNNPGLSGRVVDLEIAVAELKIDLKWIKMFVAPTSLISFISLLLLVARSQIG